MPPRWISVLIASGLSTLIIPLQKGTAVDFILRNTEVVMEWQHALHSNARCCHEMSFSLHKSFQAIPGTTWSRGVGAALRSESVPHGPKFHQIAKLGTHYHRGMSAKLRKDWLLEQSRSGQMKAESSGLCWTPSLPRSHVISVKRLAVPRGRCEICCWKPGWRSDGLRPSSVVSPGAKESQSLLLHLWKSVLS